ncbi:unnamed protein product [Dibothriocephalus latus]|uniref:Uncharacterized protein n=1 Tax=Dibothriocephalus latus TaxID=60516 RepID=A0A3P7P7X3_DIBLA|nr:unnamed protein product [Dibothriocephalus latus]
MIQDETSRQITIPCAFMRGRFAYVSGVLSCFLFRFHKSCACIFGLRVVIVASHVLNPGVLEILTGLEASGLKYAIVNFPVNRVGASIAVVHHRPWTLW